MPAGVRTGILMIIAFIAGAASVRLFGLLSGPPGHLAPPATQSPQAAKPEAEAALPKCRSSNAPVQDATDLANLPSPGKLEQYELTWDGVEGLNVAPTTEAGAKADQPSLKLVEAPTAQRHRLGFKFKPLDLNKAYRVSVWIKPVCATGILLDMRDGKQSHFGGAFLNIPKQSVERNVGEVKQAGVETRPDGWTKVWGDLTYADGVGFFYLGILSAKGEPAYQGDGTTGVILGGIEIAPKGSD